MTSYEPAMTFPYTLDLFQQQSVEAIERDENVLVTAHTSAGKSTVAEYAIAKCARLGKRSIYTSPIKTLSNQKYADFIKHSDSMGLTPDQIGIMTGDIKLKPDASCLVMTTEILRNRLFQLDTGDDFFNDIKMVVFDEVHYINDPNRGHVWEETIMMLPPHILRIMLSASMSGADRLARWVTSLHGRPTPLISTLYRPVPLSHQLYYYQTDTKTSLLVDVFRNKRFLPDNHSRDFDALYRDYLKAKKQKKSHHSHTVNQLQGLIRYLHKENQFPAIFFSFSRKKCQQHSTTISDVLVDHETRNQITRTFEFYLVRLLPEEQRSISQVLILKKCVERGVAFHHSGLLPALKEIVEILFSKGWIKVLFATETFAVGVNMPARTVVFTSLEKHDDRQWRNLRTDEYIQMSGRAGRRGLDTVGRVLLTTLDDFPQRHTLHELMCGASPYINSRLTIDPVLLLQSMDSPSFTITSLLERSLWYYQRQDTVKNLRQQIESLQSDSSEILQGIDETRHPSLEEYYQKVYKKIETGNDLSQQFADLGFAVKKGKKGKKKKSGLQSQSQSQSQSQTQVENSIISQWADRSLFTLDWERYKSYKTSLEEIDNLSNRLSLLENEIYDTVSSLIIPLQRLGLVLDGPTTTTTEATTDTPTTKIQINDIQATMTGKIASRFHECPAILTSLAFQKQVFDGLSQTEIVAVLAVLSDSSNHSHPLTDVIIDDYPSSVVSNRLKKSLHLLLSIEKTLVRTIDYPEGTLSNEMLLPSIQWSQGASLTSLREEGCDMYEGNLVRQFLKITHMAEEVVDVYTSLDLISQIVEWNEIDKIMIRDFVKVESIYLI